MRRIKSDSLILLYEKLWALPDDVVGEIFHSELVLLPKLDPLHAAIGSIMHRILSEPFQDGLDGPGDWWMLEEPHLYLFDSVIIPDCAGWKKERMPESELPDTLDSSIRILPDWVCEVLSPLTARNDRVSKLQIYEENKLPYYWIIDPYNKTLEVLIFETGRGFKMNKGFRVGPTFEGEDMVSAPPFEDIEFNLGFFWDTILKAKEQFLFRMREEYCKDSEV